MLTKKKEIWHDSLCLDFAGEGEKAQLYPCHKQGGNQEWIHKKVWINNSDIFSADTGHIKSPVGQKKKLN